MTRQEKRIVSCALAVMNALERVIKWSGTGGANQQKAWDARDKAVIEWRKVIDELEREVPLDSAKRKGK